MIKEILLLTILLYQVNGIEYLDKWPAGLIWSKCPNNLDTLSPVRTCSASYGTNICLPHSSLFYRYKQNGLSYICAKEIICKEGEVLSEECLCIPKDGIDCYHQDGCQVPLVWHIPKGTFTDEDWKNLEPQHCSIGRPKEGCGKEGHYLNIHFVIDHEGKKHLVKDLNIMWKQVTTIDKSYLHQSDDAYSINDFNGDEAYCKQHENFETCYKNMSSDKPYRGALYISEIPYLRSRTSSTPVYCFGDEKYLVFKSESIIKTSNCEKCSATCSKDIFTIMATFPGEKNINICGIYNCKIQISNDELIVVPRDFHSKVIDNRIIIDVVATDKSYTWKHEIQCETYDLCDAVDCFFCWDYLSNYKCYSPWAWACVVVVAYLLITILAGLCIIVTPIYNLIKFLGFCSCRIFCWAYKFSFWTLGKTKKSTVSIFNKVNKQIDDDLKTPLMNSQEAIEMELLQQARDHKHTPPHNPPPTRNVRKDDPAVRRLMMSVDTSRRCVPIGGVATRHQTLMILGLIFLSFGKCSAEAPCSISEITTLESESCSMREGKLDCKMSTIVKVPLVSYDQTSCAYVKANDGTVLSMIQITPISISYKCLKESLYFTREAKMTFKTLERCPGAGPCTVEWCQGLNKNTKVDGWDNVQAPYDQFCKFGEACAAHGCWYCHQPTCHPIRYYPITQDKKVYEIFRCSIWEPSALFHVRHSIGQELIESKIELKNGQTKEVSAKLSVTLNLVTNGIVPVLNKFFITDGVRYAFGDFSGPGSPVSGTIGQIQCSSMDEAHDFSKCTMAADICKCNVQFDGANCDCSEVMIDSLFNGPDHLPTGILNYQLDVMRSDIYLKTPAYGSGYVTLRVSGKVSALSEHKHTCTFSLMSVKGCYNCLKGASIEYSCTSTETYTTVMDCGDTKTVVSCNPESKTKIVKHQLNTRIISLACKVPCSKEESKTSGILEYISHPELEDASHIQLIPPADLNSMSEYISGMFSFLGIKIFLGLISILVGSWLTIKLSLSLLSNIRHQRWRRNDDYSVSYSHGHDQIMYKRM